MFLQEKINRALNKLHQESDQREEPVELEKNDLLAMMIAAFITIIPVALIVLILISVLAYFFLLH